MLDRKSLNYMLLVLIIVILSGCSSSIMKPAPMAPEQMPEDKSMVTFLRPSYFGGAIQFGLWDSDTCIGVLTANGHINYLTAPGEHVFLARAENWAYIKADLSPGKRYFVVARPFIGFWKARVTLDPISPNHDDYKKINEWLNETDPIMMIEEKRKDYADPRRAQVKEATDALDKDSDIKFTTIIPEDGR